MEAELAAQVVFFKENTRPVKGLLVDKLAQFQQERFAGDVVEPIDNHEVVATAAFSPEGPVAKWIFG